MPIGIILAFLIYCVVRTARLRDRKYRSVTYVLTAAALLLYLFACPLFSEMLIRSLETKYLPPTQVTGDVIVWLGGGATLDTPNISGKGNVSGFAASRLLVTLQLYRRLNVPVILSGGQVFKTTGPEAQIAALTLRGAGVPGNRIILEERSLNTTENAKYIRKLLQQYGFHRPILVTSAFHMPRAVKQFEKTGISVTPYPADYHVNIHAWFEPFKLLPSAEAFMDSSLAIKEYLGLWAVKWY